MEWITRAADKAGVVGTVVSALGLGVFAQYESLFMTTLLPLFAGAALLASALGWLRHRQWHRSLLGMIGPAMVLAALLLFPGEDWFATLLYAGLACMVGVSLWDLFSPANKRCTVDGCAAPQARP